jgi:gamma-glutamylcyclotransferase (GGCT)/AIG2-like uncharacterized protein YtfP
MSDYLFAYGTLQPAHAPDEVRALLAKLRYVGEASVRGVLYDLGDYPGAVLDSSFASRVFGEVFELPDSEETLAALDSYEEFDPNARGGSLFVRVREPVALESGDVKRCWIYVYHRDPGAAPVIESGRYATRE